MNGFSPYGLLNSVLRLRSVNDTVSGSGLCCVLVRSSSAWSQSAYTASYSSPTPTAIIRSSDTTGHPASRLIHYLQLTPTPEHLRQRPDKMLLPPCDLVCVPSYSHASSTNVFCSFIISHTRLALKSVNTAGVSIPSDSSSARDKV